MQGAKDLLASERGVFCCLALVAVTVLCSLRVIGSDEWLSFVRYLLGLLVISKTVTGAVERFKQPKTKIPEARVVE